MKRMFTFEKRMAGTSGSVITIRILAIVFSLLAFALFLLISGADADKIGGAFKTIFYDSFFTEFGIAATLTKATPLLITSIGISIAFRMKLWNIGGEGQIAMGAYGAAFVAYGLPDAPAYVLIPLMLIAAMLMGAFWAGISGITRAYLGVNETITTLMLNYVALEWLGYLVHDKWSKGGFAITPEIPQQSFLPYIYANRVHVGLLIGIALIVIYYLLIQKTKFGYELRVTGESPAAAEYAGMNVKKNILLAMLLSGAIAGIAGFGELAGSSHRMEAAITSGYGYTAIIVAWLSRLNPVGMLIMSVFMAGIISGGSLLTAVGFPSSVSAIMQGIIFFFVLGTDIITRYKISFTRREKA